jgi:hypothetical protein
MEIEKAEHHFEVKEYSDEQTGYSRFRIYLAPVREGLSILKPHHGLLALDLASGMSRLEAEEVAKVLQDSVDRVSCTTF